MEQLVDKLTSPITTQILLPRVRLLDNASRDSAAFNDPSYLPFYYHIGTKLKVRSAVEIGFGLGLVAACFLRGCPSIKSYLGLQEKTEQFYSLRMGYANVREIYLDDLELIVGSQDEIKSKVCTGRWDVGIISEQMKADKLKVYMDVIWNNLSGDGLLIVDYIDTDDFSEQTFRDFCKAKNREPNLYKSRYGLGIVKR
jgi:predicted O-methyltransferase YrrM